MWRIDFFRTPHLLFYKSPKNRLLGLIGRSGRNQGLRRAWQPLIETTASRQAVRHCRVSSCHPQFFMAICKRKMVQILKHESQAGILKNLIFVLTGKQLSVSIDICIINVMTS